MSELYGRKITPQLRKGTPLHLYLPGPHRGVWNIEALQASKEIILCEALLDALTFWCAGFRNVTASYGVEGFTEDHLAAFRQYGTERVLIAYDRDEAGDKAAEKLAEKLIAAGIECFRVQFPKGMDANEYALKVTPPPKSLGVLLRHAQWMGKGTPPAPPLTIEPAIAAPATPAATEEDTDAVTPEPSVMDPPPLIEPEPSSPLVAYGSATHPRMMKIVLPSGGRFPADVVATWYGSLSPTLVGRGSWRDPELLLCEHDW